MFVKHRISNWYRIIILEQGVGRMLSGRCVSVLDCIYGLFQPSLVEQVFHFIIYIGSGHTIGVSSISSVSHCFVILLSGVILGTTCSNKLGLIKVIGLCFIIKVSPCCSGRLMTMSFEESYTVLFLAKMRLNFFKTSGDFLKVNCFVY